jgi:hypothetical protein
MARIRDEAPATATPVPRAGNTPGRRALNDGVLRHRWLRCNDHHSVT